MSSHWLELDFITSNKVFFWRNYLKQSWKLIFDGFNMTIIIISRQHFTHVALKSVVKIVNYFRFYFLIKSETINIVVPYDIIS